MANKETEYYIYIYIPNKATRSVVSRPSLAKLLTRVGKSDLGEGMSLVASVASVTLPSLLPVKNRR